MIFLLSFLRQNFTAKIKMLKLKAIHSLLAPLAIAGAIGAGDVAVHSFLLQFQNSEEKLFLGQ